MNVNTFLSKNSVKLMAAAIMAMGLIPMKAAAASWQACGSENGSCVYKGAAVPAGSIVKATVRYGYGTSFATKTGQTLPVPCTNAYFGDPIKYVVKSCSYDSSTVVVSSPNANPDISVAIAAGTNLPLNGTSTKITVGFSGGTLKQLDISRDAYNVFGSYPASFFTLDSGGASVSGSFCLSSSCWLNESGNHVLHFTATFSNNVVVKKDVPVYVADLVPNPTQSPTPVPTPTPVPPTSTGAITSAMWSEIASQRAAFGDPNDCKARVDAIPSVGYVLPPGGNIADALSRNNVVILQTGTYTPTGSLLAIPTGKMLIAGPGQSPVVDLSQLTYFAAVYVGDNSVLSGIDFKNARGISIVSFDTGLGRYSNGGLIYNTKVHDSGATGTETDGTGISLYGNDAQTQGQFWCIVAVEVYDSWNRYGTDGSTTSVTAQGGNSDGVSSHFGAGRNTFIAVNSHNNADDGMDMWHGGATFHYFSTYHNNGVDLRSGIVNGGDGNGVKLGAGTALHKFYKSTANSNREGGFNLNANTLQPIFVQSSASGNGAGNYINGVIAP